MISGGMAALTGDADTRDKEYLVPPNQLCTAKKAIRASRTRGG